MAICEIHLNSVESIAKMTSLMAILPEEQGRGPFPVLYLLHGLGDDHTAWARRTNIERYVAELPLIVVMPNGARSFYSDAQDLLNQNFETLIARDLIDFVTARFKPLRRAKVAP